MGSAAPERGLQSALLADSINFLGTGIPRWWPLIFQFGLIYIERSLSWRAVFYAASVRLQASQLRRSRHSGRWLTRCSSKETQIVAATLSYVGHSPLNPVIR